MGVLYVDCTAPQLVLGLAALPCLGEHGYQKWPGNGSYMDKNETNGHTRNVSGGRTGPQIAKLHTRILLQ